MKYCFLDKYRAESSGYPLSLVWVDYLCSHDFNAQFAVGVVQEW